MSLTIPTIQQLTDIFKTNLEANLNQDAPPVDKSYINVESVVQATVTGVVLKYGTQEARESFVTTASEAGLKVFADEYGLPRQEAVAAVLAATLTGTNGVTIPGTAEYTGEPNGERYDQDASVIIAAGAAAISVTAKTPGVSGNLTVGDILNISAPIGGAATFATVTGTTTIGTEQEDLDAWRDRLLDEVRSQGGGGNTADYRDWGKQVEGVEQIYPYSGHPASIFAVLKIDITASGAATVPTSTKFDGDANSEVYVTIADLVFTGAGTQETTVNAAAFGAASNLQVGDTMTLQTAISGVTSTATITEVVAIGNVYTDSKPGDRTVYVEAETSLDSDGLASEVLIDEVRDSINADPDTYEGRAPLGETDEWLFVYSIFRTPIYVVIDTLSVESTQVGNAKAAIENNLSAYFLRLEPYMSGLTAPSDQNDLITTVTVAAIVQDALDAFGGSAQGVTIALSASGAGVTEYRLNPGEKAKLGSISYV